MRTRKNMWLNNMALKNHFTALHVVLLLGLLAAAGILKPPSVRAGETLESKTGRGNGSTLRPLPGPDETKTGVPVRVTVQEAVLMALENNRELRIERLNPAIRRTFEEEEQAVFDPSVHAEGAFSRDKGTLEPLGSTLSTTSALDQEVGVSQFFSTGTDLSLDFTAGRIWSDRTANRYASRLGLSVTQALLRGRGLDVNLASLRQARLGTRFSQYELRGFSEALVALVEKTYWSYILAQRQIDIFKNSLELAGQQLSETEEIIKVGRLAETELVAAQAEIALRRQELIEAENLMASTRLQLLRLLNPPGPNFWERALTLLDQPLVPEVELEKVSAHVRVAMCMRPELNQARLETQRGELEVVKTKNGLLPKMDLFLSLGKSGYADSFGGAFRDMPEDRYDMLVGLRFEYPFHNRRPRARHKRATLSHHQTLEALDNLSQLVELDVRIAYLECNRAEQQIRASLATRQLEEEKVRIETEKFRVGRSTSFLVAQAQRDLVRAQISEIRAVVNYLKALVDLHRVDGSLLERWGIEAPGKEPMTAPRR